MFAGMRGRVLRARRSTVTMATAALVAAVAVAPTMASGAAPQRCSKQAGKLPGAKGSALFAQGTALYVCFGKREVRRIGPWTPGRSKIAADADHESVVWTVRVGGADRVWAWRDGRAWLRGVAPSPGTLATVDRKVESLRISWLAAAWVTGGGQVVQAFDRPPVGPRDAAAFFTETYFGENLFDRLPRPAVATSMLTPPASVLALPQSVDAGNVPEGSGARSLIALTQPTGLLTPHTSASVEVLGRWPIAAGRRFAESLAITDVSAGGDPCADTFNDAWLFVSVVPQAGQPAVGWSTAFTRGATDASIEGRAEECGV